MYIELEGVVERVTYRNEENNYTVIQLKTTARDTTICAVGTLAPVVAGETLRLKGTWERHPRFGEQLKILTYEPVAPVTPEAIEKYIGSGIVKGIGPAIAHRIVERFGPETMQIMDNEPQRLREVQGIGRAKLESIKSSWREQSEIRDIMIFLKGHDISSAHAVKIYKQYKGQSLTVLREDPYRLATEISGIGFLTADSIAKRLGVPEDSPMRAEAGVLYVLQKLSDDGHVYYPYEALLERSAETLGLEREPVARAAARLTERGSIEMEPLGSEGGENAMAVYLPWLYASERGIEQRLREHLSSPRGYIERVDRAETLKWVQGELGITLSEKQKEAVTAALDEKALVITGGPGVGKTTVINSIIKIFERYAQKPLLAAPTGRAAKRMAELTGHKAKTIHRLLEWSPHEGAFRRNEGLPLSGDLIVIDEASMVDTVLMYHLLRAVPSEASIIFVGDVDQLPPVGPGNVLSDIIDSRLFRTVRLSEIFRQSGESDIITNSHRINRGEMPHVAGEREDGDFFFFTADSPEAALDRTLELCKSKIPEKFGLDPFRDIQVLSPMHKGLVGVANLNIELKRLLNPKHDELQSQGKPFSTGDKIMQIKNNYEKDVFNGDIGRVDAIDTERQTLTALIDGREVNYDFSELDELTLAYAISVHKSQGSEYPAVVIPVMTEHYIMLQRNLLYTAITRGKRLVVLVGTHKALAIAVNNDRTMRRYTRLAERLRELTNQVEHNR